jgi:Ca2+-binding EF-hand superfamily protein
MDQGNTQLPDTTASLQAKFDALDTDHDGTIDQAEAQASDVLSAQFHTLDTKGDGRLTLAEFAAATNLASVRVDHHVRQE